MKAKELVKLLETHKDYLTVGGVRLLMTGNKVASFLIHQMGVD